VKTENTGVCVTVKCKVRGLATALKLPAVQSGVYKVSINEIHPIDTPSNSHTYT
jgi:hypothetical protein